MATTTPNFGWPVPTSTDLVKDGATAIEALGDGIDTSMVDLKGGTTGQILAKATNADMDFAWVSNDVGDITAITASSPLTGGGTSGDVTIGILSGTTSNLGAVQLSTSTTSTSTSLAATSSAVKAAYDPAFTNNFYAGKNKIINGDFAIWQRGTTLSGGGYLADRFTCTTDATLTQSRQTFTPGTAPVAGYEAQYFIRYAKSAGGSFMSPFQAIEDVRTFAGQTITVSFWAKADAAVTITPYYAQNFGSGGSADVGNVIATQAITTSWVRYSFTLTLPSIAGKTVGTSSFLQIFTGRYVGAAATTIDIWGVQVEAGSTATPFQTATGTIQGELAACQRYYYQRSSLPGGAYSSTAGRLFSVHPVTMRVNPTITYPATLTNALEAVGIGNATPTALSTAEVGINYLHFNATGASGFSTGVPLRYQGNEILFSAEL